MSNLLIYFHHVDNVVNLRVNVSANKLRLYSYRYIQNVKYTTTEQLNHVKQKQSNNKEKENKRKLPKNYIPSCFCFVCLLFVDF